MSKKISLLIKSLKSKPKDWNIIYGMENNSDSIYMEHKNHPIKIKFRSDFHLFDGAFSETVTLYFNSLSFPNLSWWDGFRLKRVCAKILSEKYLKEKEKESREFFENFPEV